MAHVLNIKHNHLACEIKHTIGVLNHLHVPLYTSSFNTIFIVRAMPQLSDPERIQMIGQIQASLWIADVTRSLNISKRTVMKTTNNYIAWNALSRNETILIEKRSIKNSFISMRRRSHAVIDASGGNTHCWSLQLSFLTLQFSILYAINVKIYFWLKVMEYGVP